MTEKQKLHVEKFIKIFDIGCKLFIIAGILTVICFTFEMVTMDWSNLTGQEEDFIALEEVAYDIIENKNVTQALTDKLERYEVSFNKDGTIDISLYGSVEIIRMELSDNFMIHHFERSTSPIVFACILYFVFEYFAFCGLLMIAYGIGYGVGKAYSFIKTKIKSKRQNICQN